MDEKIDKDVGVAFVEVGMDWSVWMQKVIFSMINKNCQRRENCLRRENCERS